MTDLPKSYIPSSLPRAKPEPREHLTYGIGKVFSSIESIYYGPTLDLFEMLEVIHDKTLPYPHIIRFNKDGTNDVLYSWSCGCDVESPQWVLLIPPKH